MTRAPYKAPVHRDPAFHCPRCGAYARQMWWSAQGHGIDVGGSRSMEPATFSTCAHCEKWSLWVDGKLVLPEDLVVPEPNTDFGDEITADYLEAAAVAPRSPRAAAALLRLCIQKLMVQLGEPGKDINTDIGSLVMKGLQPKVQQALDIVRVVGNESVHPGQIDLRDDETTAVSLFALVNEIAYEMITRPREIEEMYNALPAAKLAGIEQRDGASSGTP